MFQCKDLLALPALSKVRVVSGQGGLGNGIRWVYTPDNMHFSKWVKGRELLIISTPVIQSEDFDLFLLVQEAVQMNLSGALLLVGNQYIDRIPKEVVAYTNQNKFPLFVISGDIPLIDIFEEIGHAIAYYDNKEEDSDDVLSGIIFGNEINVDALVLKSEMLGYDITPPQQIFVFHVYSSNRLESYDRNVIGDKIKQGFFNRNIPIVLSRYGNNFVGMFQVFSTAGEQIKEIYKEIEAFMQEEYPGWEICLGIGRGYERLDKLQYSFKEASRCITLADKKGKRSGVYDYKELGLFNLLLELEDTRLVQEYIDNTIGCIISYDEENHTELLQTLKIYMQNNCSLLHTAEQLHTHRNTVKYRIQRVEEITGKDMENAMTRLEFMNAILCHEICRV